MVAPAHGEARNSGGSPTEINSMAGGARTEASHGARILFRGRPVLRPLGPVGIRVNAAARSVAVVANRLVAETDVGIVAGHADGRLRGSSPIAVAVGVGPFTG